MAESDIIAALKVLQTQLEGQIVASSQAFAQVLQEFKSSVESRFAELQNSPFTPGPRYVFSSHNHQHNPSTPPEVSSVMRSMKMEVPRFDGSDPEGWIFREEEFFDFHGTPEPTRLRIVSFHMEGRPHVGFNGGRPTTFSQRGLYFSRV